MMIFNFTQLTIGFSDGRKDSHSVDKVFLDRNKDEAYFLGKNGVDLAVTSSVPLPENHAKWVVF